MEIVLGLLKHYGEWDYFWLLKRGAMAVLWLGIWITCITIIIKHHRKNKAIKRYFSNQRQNACPCMAMSHNNYANPLHEDDNYRYHHASAAHNNTGINDQHTYSDELIMHHHHDYHNSYGAPQMGTFTDYTSHLSGYPTMYTDYSNSSHHDYNHTDYASTSYDHWNDRNNGI